MNITAPRILLLFFALVALVGGTTLAAPHADAGPIKPAASDCAFPFLETVKLQQ